MAKETKPEAKPSGEAAAEDLLKSLDLELETKTSTPAAKDKEPREQKPREQKPREQKQPGEKPNRRNRGRE